MVEAGSTPATGGPAGGDADDGTVVDKFTVERIEGMGPARDRAAMPDDRYG